MKRRENATLGPRPTERNERQASRLTYNGARMLRHKGNGW